MSLACALHLFALTDVHTRRLGRQDRASIFLQDFLSVIDCFFNDDIKRARSGPFPFVLPDTRTTHICLELRHTALFGRPLLDAAQATDIAAALPCSQVSISLRFFEIFNRGQTHTGNAATFLKGALHSALVATPHADERKAHLCARPKCMGCVGSAGRDRLPDQAEGVSGSDLHLLYNKVRKSQSTLPGSP